MKSGPDKVHGPRIADAFQKFCEAVAKESGATGVRVTAEFLYKKGKGDLQMKTFTTPDAKTERMLDVDVSMPRGSKLMLEASMKLRSEMTHLTKKLGGK